MPHYTPDGRYFVVEGKLGPRLWRASNPGLGDGEREELVKQLMNARRALRGSPRASETSMARAAVQQAKVALGERGPVWWDDGAPDFNRRLVRNSPYAAWWDAFSAQQKD